MRFLGRLPSLALTQGWAPESMNRQLRRRAEGDRLQDEIQLLREEVCIKDAQMEQLEVHRRPHYPPMERLANLQLRAARAWSFGQTARTFRVTPLTIASWMGRLDEEGPDALVRLPNLVNKFPELIAYLVGRLRPLCRRIGKVKIAQILARASLHLGPTTVSRILRDTRYPEPRKATQMAPSVVTSRHPNHLWHLDLTTVPNALGFWTSWLPFVLPQVWPFCWWIAIAVDHFSRRDGIRGLPRAAWELSTPIISPRPNYPSVRFGSPSGPVGDAGSSTADETPVPR